MTGARLWLGTARRSEQRLEISPQHGHRVLNDVPSDFVADDTVPVDELIAERDDAIPLGDALRGRCISLIQLRESLTDDREVPIELRPEVDCR
jgi:hypothetical protein